MVIKYVLRNRSHNIYFKSIKNLQLVKQKRMFCVCLRIFDSPACTRSKVLHKNHLQKCN